MEIIGGNKMKNKISMNLQRFAKATILDLFSNKLVLDYTRNREYAELLGETLFPERKTDSLELEQINGGSRIPVIASVHAWDTEAEIGSREASKMGLDLALVKRKLPLKEKDIIALENPRTPAEQKYLMEQVYNDIDVLVQGVRARAEKMRMEVLANGTVSLDENGIKATIDYNVPSEHKEVLAGTATWDNEASDPLADIERWVDALDVTPTRALTSKKVYRLLMRHPKVVAAVFGKDTGRVVSIDDFDAFMTAHGFPIFRTYDVKYKKQAANGTYTSERYFPENKIAFFNDDLLGETIYGPTAEEIRLTRDPSIETGMVGNVFTCVYEEGADPVSTWKKAVATVLPSFAAADEVFQAQPIA